jgi:vacuolar-type H+-ATPase subunit I/STV1
LEPVRDTEAVHRALHRAVVETYTLHLNGTDPAGFFSIDTPVTEERVSERVNVAVAEDGEVRFEFLGPEVEGAILSSLEPVKKAEPEPVEESVAETEAAPAETEAAPAEAAEVVAEAEAEAEAVVETPEAVPEVQEEAAVTEVEQLSRPQWLEQGLQGEGWVKLPLRQDALKFAVFIPATPRPRVC